MNVTRVFLFVAGFVLSGTAQTQTRSPFEGVPPQANMLFCTGAGNAKLAVWTDRNDFVVAVAAIREADKLPAFARPLVRSQAHGVNDVGGAARRYRVVTQGPAYDMERVLTVGATRLSCVGNNDD